MSYLPGIPAASDIPSQSQAQIKGNFTALDNIFDIDHVKYSATADNGKHKTVSFNDVIPNEPTAIPSSLYTKKDAGGLAQLIYENASLITQLTKLTVVESGTNYGITTPWGIIINWGSTTVASGSDESASTAFAIPFTTTKKSINISQYQYTSSRLAVTTFSLTNYRVKRTDSTDTLIVYYIAIGV